MIGSRKCKGSFKVLLKYLGIERFRVLVKP